MNSRVVPSLMDLLLADQSKTMEKPPSGLVFSSTLTALKYPACGPCLHECMSLMPMPYATSQAAQCKPSRHCRGTSTLPEQ